MVVVIGGLMVGGGGSVGSCEIPGGEEVQKRRTSQWYECKLPAVPATSDSITHTDTCFDLG